jgi:hypothetical protein
MPGKENRQRRKKARKGRALSGGVRLLISEF